MCKQLCIYNQALGDMLFWEVNHTNAHHYWRQVKPHEMFLKFSIDLSNFRWPYVVYKEIYKESGEIYSIKTTLLNLKDVLSVFMLGLSREGGGGRVNAAAPL